MLIKTTRPTSTNLQLEALTIESVDIVYFIFHGSLYSLRQQINSVIQTTDLLNLTLGYFFSVSIVLDDQKVGKSAEGSLPAPGQLGGVERMPTRREVNARRECRPRRESNSPTKCSLLGRKGGPNTV